MTTTAVETVLSAPEGLVIGTEDLAAFTVSRTEWHEPHVAVMPGGGDGGARSTGASSWTTTVVEFPVSPGPRGLSLVSFRLEPRSSLAQRLFGWHRQHVYVTSLAFDMSKAKPVLMPPADLPAKAIYKVRRGEEIALGLGEGAPLFPARTIHGGLAVYVMVMESDEDIQKVGKVLDAMHTNLAADGSVVEKLAKLAANPTGTLTDEILAVATAAMKPIAAVLSANDDDFVAPFQGYFSATKPWTRLAGKANGVHVELREI